MNLLLTSTSWKENEEIKNEFFVLTNKIPSDIKILFVNTAKKGDYEWGYAKGNIEELKEAGIKEDNIIIVNLDKKIEENDLKNIDIVYVCGGNTFHYLYKIRKIGLDIKIKELVEAGASYFGMSAGGILAGPKIDIAQICDGDTNDINLQDLKGLQLTNIIILPHYLPTYEDEIKEFEDKNDCKVIRLTDKQALLIKEGNQKIIC